MSWVRVRTLKTALYRLLQCAVITRCRIQKNFVMGHRAWLFLFTGSKSALTSFRISLNCFCCHHLACWFTAAFQKCYFTMGAGGNQPAKFLSGLMNYKTRAKSINLHTLQLELAKWTAQQFGRRDPGCTQLTGQLPLLFTSAIKFAHRFCHAQTFSKLGLLKRHVQYFGDLIEPREKSKILETALRTLQDPFKSTMIGTLFIFQTLLATMNPFIHIGKS